VIVAYLGRDEKSMMAIGSLTSQICPHHPGFRHGRVREGLRDRTRAVEPATADHLQCIFPNCLAPIIVQASLALERILMLQGLSFWDWAPSLPFQSGEP